MNLRTLFFVLFIFSAVLGNFTAHTERSKKTIDKKKGINRSLKTAKKYSNSKQSRQHGSVKSMRNDGVSKTSDCCINGGRKYEIRYNSEPIITLCYSYTQRITFWTRHTIKRTQKDPAPPTKKIFSDAEYNIKNSHPDKVYEQKPHVYDRGHLVPNADFKEDAAPHTYYYVNTAPQKTYFNGAVWAKLEMKIRTDPNLENLDIYTGTLHSSPPSMLREVIPIPEYFWKVVVDKTDPKNQKAVAFIGFNKDKGEDISLEEFTTLCHNICPFIGFCGHVVTQFIICCGISEFLKVAKEKGVNLISDFSNLYNGYELYKFPSKCEKLNMKTK